MMSNHPIPEDGPRYVYKVLITLQSPNVPLTGDDDTDEAIWDKVQTDADYGSARVAYEIAVPIAMGEEDETIAAVGAGVSTFALSLGCMLRLLRSPNIGGKATGSIAVMAADGTREDALAGITEHMRERLARLLSVANESLGMGLAEGVEHGGRIAAAQEEAERMAGSKRAARGRRKAGRN